MLMVYSEAISQDLIQRIQQTTHKSAKEMSNADDWIMPFTQSKRLKSTAAVEGAVYLDYKPQLTQKLLARDAKRPLTLAIPVSQNQHVVLDLKPIEIRSSDFVIVDAFNNPLPIPQKKFYKGHLVGDAEVKATMSIDKEGMQVMIMDAQGNYSLTKTNGNDQYILYNDRKLKANHNFQCLNDEIEIPSFESALPKNDANHHYKSSTNNCVRVFLELDNTSYTSFNGDMTALTNFAEGAMSNVIALYDNIGIKVLLEGIKIWNTSDSYGAQQNVQLALENMRFNRAGNIHAQDGDLVLLVSAKNKSNHNGLAYVLQDPNTGILNYPTTCIGEINQGNGPEQFRFSVAQVPTIYSDIPQYSPAIYLMTHELGHNLGSPHTHNCFWGANNNTQIDDCGSALGDTQYSSCYDANNPIIPSTGTIMSYCISSLALEFDPQVIALLQDRYQNDMPCLTACPQSAVLGCTNPYANNYNSLADQDDGSCTFDCNNTTSTANNTSPVIITSSASLSTPENLTLSNSTTYWQSQNEINFLNGFEINTGLIFEANIDDCN